MTGATTINLKNQKKSRPRACCQWCQWFGRRRRRPWRRGGDDAHVGREQGDLGHDARLMEAVEGGNGGQPGVGRELEDLDLGVVHGEQHLAAALVLSEEDGDGLARLPD